jgi:tetratricopeptide (TPR) repeat protein
MRDHSLSVRRPMGGLAIAALLLMQACASSPTTEAACNGTTAEDHYECGCHYHYDLRDYPAAIHEYSEALQVDPHYAPALNNRGIIYRETGQLRAALEDFTAVIHEEPTNVFAYNNRANAFRQKNEQDFAMADLYMAISIDPTFADSFYGRAELRLKAGDLDGAIEDYTKAILFYAEAANGPSDRVRLWFDRGQYRSPSRANPQIRVIDESLADAYFWRSRMYASLNQPTKADDDLRAARLIDPEIDRRRQIPE